MKYLPNRLISLMTVSGSTFQISLLLLFLISVGQVTAGDKDRYERAPTYTILHRSIDKNIKEGNAQLVFTCRTPEGNKLSKRFFTLNYNAKNHYVYTDTFGVGTHELKAGRYKFYLFGYDYKEIPMDTLQIASQEKIEISVRFESDNHPHPVRKPVIYLYPTVTTDVRVQLNVKGELTFSYPSYNHGWDVTAQPDGTLESDGKLYNYLFWEAHPQHVLPEGNKNEGVVVATDTLLHYLQQSLTAMGLTSKEQQDFITYWYPMMQRNEKNHIQFIFNEDCNTYAGLHITPAPTTIYRVYMVWENAVGRDFTNLRKLSFPILKREGFTVVEWGGIELKTTDLNFCGN